jgi:thioredoxin 1
VENFVTKSQKLPLGFVIIKVQKRQIAFRRMIGRVLNDTILKSLYKKKGISIMSVLVVTSENFEAVKNSEKTVLLDFYADWCGPCRMVAPFVAQIADEHPEYLICKINVDNSPELAKEFGIMSIPTLVVLKDGKVVKQSEGARPKAQILAMLEG